MATSHLPLQFDDPTRPSPNPVPLTIDPSTFRLCAAPFYVTMPERVGHYHITRELGRGGMGIVYEGYDSRLKRTVAVKMIRDAGGPDSADLLSRFQTEAEAVAQLHHPNIVQIFEVGWSEERPFVALEYLPGGSLLGRTGTKPQPPREAADVVRVTAAAMHHAHQHGVVHRDLKPANILYDADDHPKVTDFGAARLILGEGAAQTRVGEVIGTPQYMAPEQARGTPDAAGPSIDIYALGAILYQQLTGRPPFDGPDPFEILRLVTSADPIPPRRLVPKVPRDLETICLKCLEKHPGKRYRTAADLADDLERFLAGETIRAKPATVVEKVWKKARRKPAEATLSAGLVLVAAIGLVAVLAQWRNAVAARYDAESNATAARQAEIEATQAKESAERERDIATRPEAAAAAALDSTRVAPAADLWDKGEVQKAKSLIRANPTTGVARDWEWHHVHGVIHNRLWEVNLTEASGATESQWVNGMAVSPDGSRVVVGGWNPYVPAPWTNHLTTLYLIRTADGTVERMWPKAFPGYCDRIYWQSAERFVTRVYTQQVFVWDVAADRPVHASPPPDANSPRHCPLDPDGTAALYSTDGTEAVVWDAVRGRSGPRLSVPGRTLNPQWIGNGAAVCSDEQNHFHCFDSATGELRFSRTWGSGLATVSPDGGTLIVGSQHGSKTTTGTSAWDARTGRQLWERMDGRGYVGQFRFTPDGRHVADLAPGAGDARVWSVASGPAVHRLYGHHGVVNGMALSPDGQFLATAGDDHTARLWRVVDGVPMRVINGHQAGVRTVGFTADGSGLITGGADGRVMLWDLTRDHQRHRSIMGTPGWFHLAGTLGAMAFTPDGRLRVAECRLGLADFDPTTANPITYRRFAGGWQTGRNGFDLIDWVLTPDGRLVVGTIQESETFLPVGSPVAPFQALAGAAVAELPNVSGRGGVVGVWDGATGAVRWRFDARPGDVYGVAVSPDGSLAAAYVNKVPPGKRAVGTVLVWNLATGQELHRLPMPFAGAALAFSPDSKTLFASPGRFSPTINVIGIDLATGTQTVWPGVGHALSFRSLAVSPDGALLAGSCWKTGALIVWDVATKAIRWRIDEGIVFTHLAFSPDGRRLAGTNYSGTVTLWDARAGREAYSLAGQPGRLMDLAYPARLAFSPDGRFLAVNQHHNEIFIWEADRDPSDERRRAEAITARYRFHLQTAFARLDDNQSPAAFRFHRDQLRRLDAPTDALRMEYAELVRRGEGR